MKIHDYDKLDYVHLAVNRSMTYEKQGKEDRFVHGSVLEQTMCGDCDDYVVLKAHRLKKMGIHPDNMCLGCLDTVGDETVDHAVLLVRTTAVKGFWFWKRTVNVEVVLDNRFSSIYTTDEIRERVTSRIDIRKWI